MKKLLGLTVFSLAVVIIAHLFLPSFSGKTIEVAIPRGSSSKEIAQHLADRGVIGNAFLFLAAAAIAGYDEKLRAGVYEFTEPTLTSVLSMLRTGQVKCSKITVTEGLPAWEVEKLLVGARVLDAASFRASVHRVEDARRSFGWLPVAHSLEGYLFPDTYSFELGRDGNYVIKQFLERFEDIVLPLHRSRTAQDLTLHEVVTLASIVEKEAMLHEERPVIAAVFHNRLARRMRLCADPTVKYALGNFEAQLSKRALSAASAYNTYLHHGLPPGPICSPGADSIRAVLWPAEVDFLFFVARGDGTHEFTKTYAEHRRAIEKYRKG